MRYRKRLGKPVVTLLLLGVYLYMGGYLQNVQVGFERVNPFAAQPAPQEEGKPFLEDITVATPESFDKVQPTLAVARPAGTPPDPEEITQIWNAFRTTHKLAGASMALGQGGKILHSQGTGRDPSLAYPVASLSKPVTAVCLNHALAQTGYDWSSTLGDLAPRLAATNTAPHDGIQSLTLGDLATHRSGFPKQYGKEETAGEGRNLYTQQHFTRVALSDPSKRRKNNKHHYSNVNYALLGHMVTVLTGAPYSEYCRTHVMAPAGAGGAAVAGRMWGTQGFGGWVVSAEDYARFAMHWMHADRPWIADARTLPFDRRSGAGLGIFHKPSGESHVVGHTGIWKHKNKAHQHGAIFLTSSSGFTFVANWQGALPPQAYSALWAEMSAALR